MTKCRSEIGAENQRQMKGQRSGKVNPTLSNLGNECCCGGRGREEKRLALVDGVSVNSEHEEKRVQEEGGVWRLAADSIISGFNVFLFLIL